MAKPELAVAYLRRSRAYLEAAKRVVYCEPPHQSWLHAPSLLLAGFGYEVLFKSSLLGAGATEDECIAYRHNLYRLWNDSRLASLRSCLARETMFPSRLKMLSDFHSGESNYTLRYPNGFPTLEAEIDPLIEALEDLIEFQERDS